MKTQANLSTLLSSALGAFVLFATSCSGGGGGSAASTEALGAFSYTGQVHSIDPATAAGQVDIAPTGYATVKGFARDSGRNLLYAVDRDTSSLLRIDRNGRVRRIASLEFAPAWMVHDPVEDRLIAVRRQGGVAPVSDVVEIDPATGAVEVLTSTPTRAHALAFDGAMNRLLAVAGGTVPAPLNIVIGIDLDTGATETIFEHPTVGTLTGMTFDPATRLLWGVDAIGGLYSFDMFGVGIQDAYFYDRPLDGVDLDVDTGRFFGLARGGTVGELPIGPAQNNDLDPIVTLGRELHGLTFDPADHRFFAIDWANNELVKVDPRDGSAVSIGLLPDNPFGNRRDIQSLAYDPMLNRLVGVDRSIAEVIDIDPSTGDCSEFGLTIGSETRLAIDLNTGRIYGYDEAVEVLVEVDLVAVDKYLIDNAIGLTKVDAIAFDPVTGRLLASHETPGLGGEPMLSSISTTGGGGVEYHIPAPDWITGLGHDPQTGLFHAAGPGQPWFELEMDLTSNSSAMQRVESVEGAWREGYTAAVNVPSKGVVYVVSRDRLYEYDTRDKGMRLRGRLPMDVTFPDLVYDPATDQLGLFKNDQIRWINARIPFSIVRTTSLTDTSDMTIACNPATGKLFGVRDGRLFEFTPAGIPERVTEQASIPFNAEGLAYSTAERAVFALGRSMGDPTDRILRFDLADGFRTEAGEAPATVSALFAE